MFVLSAGLFKPGAVNFLGEALGRLGQRGFIRAAVTIMLIISVISAFINNTAALIFLPIVVNPA